MSANNSMAVKAQSSHVSPLAGAVALAAIVALGAIGIATSQGLGAGSSAGAAKAGPVVLIYRPMSGPRTAAQKGLTTASVFPDYFQRLSGAGAAAAPASVFPDYFQRQTRAVSDVDSPRIPSHLRTAR